MTPPGNRSLSPRSRPAAPRPAPGAMAAAPRRLGPTWSGTCLFLATLLVAWWMPAGRTGSQVAHTAAMCVGIGVLLSTACDLGQGLGNLVRSDLFALLAYYFLTLFEFLFPQPEYDALATVSSTVKALWICYAGFAGLALGRHFVFQRQQPFRRLLTTPIAPGSMVTIFLCCALVGYLNMLVAVHFNVVEMVEAFMGPRFSQPWGRGKLGDWKALFTELEMLLFLLPPMAGIIFARRRHYRGYQLWIVGAVFLFTIFYGFTSGTRHVFDSYLVTFLIAYSFSLQQGRKHELVYVSAACAVLLIASTVMMLQFREMGLKNYMAGATEIETVDKESLKVDLNLYPMSLIAAAFPNRHDYLGMEIIYLSIIRPIPRAIWKSKPEGMSVSIEDIVGAQGWTVAATFAGEAYMSGGLVAVLLVALVFGWIAGWWNGLVSEENSELGCLIYASGFFSAVVSMRSMLVFTTAILPTIAAFVLAYYAIGKGVKQLRRLPQGRGRAPVPRKGPPAAIPRR